MSNNNGQKLAGKVAVVTGGSRGIGAAITKRLGADVCRLNVQSCPKRLPKPLCFSLRTRPPSSRVRPSLSMAANWPANSRGLRRLHSTMRNEIANDC